MKHFTHVERYEIKALLSQSLSYRIIGKQMQKSPSAISREVRKEGGKAQYDPERAQQRYIQHRQRTPYKFDGQMQEAIIHALQQQYSPEQIAERRKKEGQPTVSHERIYQSVICLIRLLPNLCIRINLLVEHCIHICAENKNSERNAVTGKTIVAVFPIDVCQSEA